MREARKGVKSAQTALERSDAAAELYRREQRLFRIVCTILGFGCAGIPAAVVGALTGAPFPVAATLMIIGTISLLVVLIAAIWSYKL